MEEIRLVNIAMELMGIAFCIFGIFETKARDFGFDIKGKRTLIELLIAALGLLIFDTISWIFYSGESQFIYYTARISITISFILTALMMALFSSYVDILLDNRPPRWIIYFIHFLSGFVIVLTLVSLKNQMIFYFDEMNVYHRGQYFYLTQVSGIVGMLLIFGIIQWYRQYLSKNTFISLMIYIIFPTIALAIQSIVYGLSILNMSMMFSVVIMRFLTYSEQTKLLQQRQKEVLMMQSNMLVSQIGPHFIFNTLTTIKCLCRTNPKLAEETIDDLAMYLRVHLDSITHEELVHLKDEINNVSVYANIEKLRFGEKINIEYILEVEDCLLPPLTIQPLVENAIKYGITKRKEGGTVTISTRKKENGIEIVVEDDGIGFDVNEMKKDNKVHVGVVNVTRRVEYQCHGKVTLESTPNVGTKATIFLPND